MKRDVSIIEGSEGLPTQTECSALSLSICNIRSVTLSPTLEGGV